MGQLAVTDATENFWQRFSRHTAFADTLAARAGGPHFEARSGRPGAISPKVIADMTPLTKAVSIGQPLAS
jgi:hypothetical protein